MSRTSFTKIRGGVRDETSFNILLGGKHQVCHVNWLNLPPFCLSGLFIWSFVRFFLFCIFSIRHITAKWDNPPWIFDDTLMDSDLFVWVMCVRMCVRKHSYDLLTLCSFSDVSTATQMKDKTSLHFASFHVCVLILRVSICPQRKKETRVPPKKEKLKISQSFCSNRGRERESESMEERGSEN